VLGSPPSGTRVRLRLLERDCYAENGCRLDASDLPVFVTLQKRHLPTDAELDAEVAALTRAVAQATGRSAGRVHIEYAPAAANRIAFGGTVVR